MAAITFDGRAYFVACREQPRGVIRMEKNHPSVGEPPPPQTLPLGGTFLLAVNAYGVSCALLIKRFPLYFLHQHSPPLSRYLYTGWQKKGIQERNIKYYLLICRNTILRDYKNKSRSVLWFNSNCCAFEWIHYRAGHINIYLSRSHCSCLSHPPCLPWSSLCSVLHWLFSKYLLCLPLTA